MAAWISSACEEYLFRDVEVLSLLLLMVIEL